MRATVAHLAEQHIRNVQVAGSIPASGSIYGALAQLGARLTGSQEVTGSSPVCSTRLRESELIQFGFFGSVKNVGVEPTLI